MRQKQYIAIDLKSFYASVECVKRGMDPLSTNLVVADKERTSKTICLAVSPSLKALGIPGRPRLFEVMRKAEEINAVRRNLAPGRCFSGSSSDALMLQCDPSLSLEYIVAAPRMTDYMKYSTEIYNIYLKYVAPEDIHVYSVDEVFIDATDYLALKGMSAHEFALQMIHDVLQSTGITATAGIGTNLYLCKIAMDIQAKHCKPDADGVRIAQLDESSYRRKLWQHRPITDFWRVGNGYAKKLAEHGMYTMGDVARCSMGGKGSLLNEELLFSLFGVNAELLIDHAWGYEPCTIADIKAYSPQTESITCGQVLKEPYDFTSAGLIVREMTDALALELVERGMKTDSVILTVGYDTGSDMSGEQVQTDRYGRLMPKSDRGSVRLQGYTSSSRRLMKAVSELYEQITNRKLLVRRLNLTAGNVLPEKEAACPGSEQYEQLDLFSPQTQKALQDREENGEKEKRLQTAMIAIKRKYGKNAIVRGMDLQQGATAMERNAQVGGHRA